MILVTRRHVIRLRNKQNLMWKFLCQNRSCFTNCKIVNRTPPKMLFYLTQAGLEAARERGKFPGRPRSLKKGDLDVARTLLKDPKISVSEIAKRIQVSEATFYRYFPGGSMESLGE